jgi:hypothetical protein
MRYTQESTVLQILGFAVYSHPRLQSCTRDWQLQSAASWLIPPSMSGLCGGHPRRPGMQTARNGSALAGIAAPGALTVTPTRTVVNVLYTTLNHRLREHTYRTVSDQQQAFQPSRLNRRHGLCAHNFATENTAVYSCAFSTSSCPAEASNTTGPFHEALFKARTTYGTPCMINPSGGTRADGGIGGGGRRSITDTARIHSLIRQMAKVLGHDCLISK